MTREQAIKAFAIAVHVPDVEYFNQTVVRVTPMINGFVALGMLKFDEPKSIKSKALDALFKQFGAHDIETMLGLLDEGGLKIVEKDSAR